MRVALFALSVFGLLWTVPALAETRVALVVGIGNYGSLARLANPANDARVMAATLKGLGFRLVGGGPQIDPDRGRLLDLLDAFGQEAKGALAVAYLAGHGSQNGGVNYLIPSDDGRIQYREHLKNWAVSVDQILAELRGAETAVVLLDACRNNPLPSRETGRNAERGLARLNNPPQQSLVMFAAQPGEVAKTGRAQATAPLPPR